MGQKEKKGKIFHRKVLSLTIQITPPLYANTKIILLESSVAVTATVASVAAAAISAAAATTITTASAAVTASVSTTAIAAAATIAAAAGTISTTTAAAISTAITATVATSVSATAGATTTAASVLLVRFFNGHFLAADRSVIECFNSLAGFCVVWHIYEPKAFTLPCFPVHHNFRKVHCAVQFEHLFQVYVIKIIRKTCYKKLHADRFKR
jgi:hypothetical protein